jgi:putative oxidoreductase
MMDEPLFSWTVLVARVLVSTYFLVSAIHKGVWFSKAAQEFVDLRVPFARFTLVVTIALHLVASVCLIVGIYVEGSALSLAIFTLLATWWVHDFWNRTGREALVHSRIAQANIGVVGGLMLLAAVGPGRLALV